MKRLASALILLSLAAHAKDVALSFTIPSGATSEASRFYFGLVHEFNEANPGVHVEFHPMSDWDEVVNQVGGQVKAGRSAGVFVAEVSETLELEQMGALTPFDDLFAQEAGGVKAFAADLLPQFVGNSYCSTGALCGPPFVRSTPVALYNLDHLQAIGVDANHLPTTWADLETLLERLKAHGSTTPFVLGGDWYDYLFEAMVREAGGSLYDADHRHITLDTPEAVRALQFWHTLKQHKLLERATSWKATLNGFVDGHFPVVFYSSGGMETARTHAGLHWMADMLPRDKAYGVAVGGGNLYLSAHMTGEERGAALKFVRFLYQPATQARISLATGFFPVVDAAFSEQAFNGRYTHDEPFVRVRRQLPYAHPKLMTLENLRVRNILKHAIDNCLDDDMPPQKALQQAQREVEQLKAGGRF
ncbi:MAG: extracellular solute-binding protein [Burkholderiales bacterium]|nr:extracellular solute-binding protein [Burkholderiales bacterium]